MGFIECELLYLKDKYNLDIETIFSNELEIANVLSKGLLEDIPDKIIFKDSDIEIVNYLNNEYGIKVGMLYYDLSSNMKKLKNKSDYYDINKIIDYSSILDNLYGFISNKHI